MKIIVTIISICILLAFCSCTNSKKEGSDFYESSFSIDNNVDISKQPDVAQNNANIKHSLFIDVPIAEGGVPQTYCNLYYQGVLFGHIDMLTKSAIDDYVKNAEFIGSVKRIDYTQEPVEDFECTFLFDGTALYLTDSGLIVASVTDEMAVAHEGVTYHGALLGTAQDFYNYYGIEIIE